MPIKNLFIISFGESHLSFNIIHDNNTENKHTKLAIKVLEGPKADQSFYYSFKDAPITIGRSEDCSLRLKSNTLSRVQSTIYYEDSNWLIVDGNGQKQSMNGTWLFVEEYFQIFDNMIIKGGLAMLQANFKQ